MIELKNITKRFGDFIAVDDISLQIKAGEFLTLLGPSGCGKTTLLRMISGFESPNKGQILLAGEDVTGLPPYRREVNQVFQSYALFPHLTVEENIAFGLRMRRMPRAVIASKVAAAIEMVSLTGLENRKPDQLSGGQRQRVALSRALVCEPKVLLLDEPLAALDAKLRRSMQIELKRLQSRVGITFVFVTHDQEEAMTMSDRIAVMNRGRIEQLGAPAAMYHRPATAFVASFLGQTNLLPAKVISRDGSQARVRLSDGSELTCDLSDFPNAEDLLLSIRPEKLTLQASHDTGDNLLEVELIDRTFKGAFEQIQLRTIGGLDLVAVAATQTVPLPAGARLFCRVQTADLVPLKNP